MAKKRSMKGTAAVRTQLSGIAAAAVAETEMLRKKPGELDTEFVKRIVAAYVVACAAVGHATVERAL